MSLVNDMLIALEQREGLDEKQRQALGCTPASESQFKTMDNKNWLAKVGVFSLLLGVGAAGAYGWLIVGKTSEQQTISKAGNIAAGLSDTFPDFETIVFNGNDLAITENHANKGQLLAEDRVVLSNLSVVRAKPLPVISESSLENQTPTNSVDRLLELAEKALEKDRLTSPIDDNAYARFQSVLAIDAKNEDAIKGLQTIVDRYLGFADITAKRGDVTSSKGFIAKAELVVSTQSVLQQYLEEKIASLEVVQNNPSDTEAATQATEQAATQADIGEQVEIVGDNAEKLSVTKSITFQDAKVVAEAKQYEAQGLIQEAEFLLVDAIASNPKLIKSQEHLFLIYSKNGQADKAHDVLHQYSGDTFQKQFLQARAAIENKEWQQAVALLKGHPFVERDSKEDAISLLAGAYQRAGSHREAIHHYQYLVQAYPRNATYWLGLALSFEGINDSSNALRAFRFARMHGGLNKNATSFVQQRIALLSNGENLPGAGG